MDYSESSYFSFLLDAINTPPNFEKSLDSAELPNYSFRHTDLANYFPPSLHLSPASSNSTLSNSSNFSNELFTCLPSPTNSVIDAKNPSPLLQPHYIKSHKLEEHHHFQEVANQQNQQQSILTIIDSKNKGKKYIGKKQKKINELPYAPNLLNLQLTPPPKTSISNPDVNCSSKKAPKNHSPSSSSSTYVISTNLTLSPSSSSNKTSSAYRCDYPNCDKVFTRPYNLKSHRRTHTAERPFDCPLCPKSFARQHDRNRHAKLHLGIKPYTCQFCTKSFARQDALNRHQRMDDTSSPTCARSIRARKTKNPPPPPSSSSISFDLSSSSVLLPPFVSSSPLSSNAMLFSSCTL
ncbi:unnamed protein product [Absidia cylindrospora]